MKILVTGGTGFIGSHLLKALAEDGHSLHILVRSADKASKVMAYGTPFVGNMQDASSLEKSLAGMEAVIHAAGVTRGNHRQDFMAGNAGAAENLARACMAAAAQVDRIVHLSSLSAFGPALTDTPPSEDDEPAPVSDYGCSKLDAERALDRLLPGVRCIHMRLTAVYGPGDRETLSFFKFGRYGTVFIPGDGRQRIQMLYVADAVESIRRALRQDVEGPFFIAHPRVLSFSDLMLAVGQAMDKRLTVIPVHGATVRVMAWTNERMGRLLGYRTMFNPQKAREMLSKRWICSTEKAQNMLHFACAMDFPEGARESYLWYRKNHWI
jgi:nucleoside-diphosphate-sugar epimerase